MNAGESGWTLQAYGAVAIPTLILFKSGRLQEKVVGVLPKAKLVDLIAKRIRGRVPLISS